jgi:hypothetical protein
MKILGRNSLLATLGKLLESVVAERISHAVESIGFSRPITSVPVNNGRRNQRSYSSRNRSILYGEVEE